RRHTRFTRDWSSEVCSSDLPPRWSTAGGMSPDACRRSANTPPLYVPNSQRSSRMYQATDYPEIREAVARLCARFPGEYWRDCDRQMAYPKEFVDALTEAGWLSVLIPEEYGGAGLPLSAAAAVLEEIQRAGCNGGACH